MKRMIAIAACIASLSVAASAQDAKWITIVDGKTMGDFDKVGAANWRIEDGALVADKLEGKDPSYLVTKEKYKDFQIQAEFWAASLLASWNRALRCPWALKIWTSAMPLIVSSSSPPSRRLFITIRLVVSWIRRPTYLNVINASGESASATIVICHESASR